ncbi:MAG TPA: hypothetical protein PK331_11585 [Gordonia sp. (in: high G+C Gram-positive bacteria)]|uniref:hypothetical protein n=1 Tax=unclassified Gordonia (in: high G+C Gram-positive bacteria) TaxID=2657482 RepID=UPI0025C5BBBC|nr:MULTISPECIES: hypothetical protein [unclassified Gordonia (in: high G+C Gram-positive bacteria)]HNP55386.1 hypothetical protein [Gordonia sp. (in: high G+C Gram-positive bacteria)]HRC51544.1 hypothetical protein [Gordonia sp. (in: high G+C Gram-positive bacteria)]
MRAGASSKLWVRGVAVATLSVFAIATITGNGSAAAVTQNPALLYQNQVAKKAKPKAEPKMETYQQRIDRIARSPHSMLRPLKENADKATVCVSGEFTTLRVVYDSLWESIYPILPRELQGPAHGAKAAAHRDMAKIHVSTLAVSDNPMAHGADRSKNGGARYRTATSAWIVDSLLKIRDGKQNEAIALENITLQQAVETAWLYLFATVVAPLRIGAAFLPYSGAVLGGEGDLVSLPGSAGPIPAGLWGFITGYLTGLTSYNTLLNIGFAGWQLVATYVYQAISNAFINQCVARVTAQQRDAAGKPSDTVKYNIPIPAIIQGAADQLALADAQTCKPVSSLPLSRIVLRTSAHVESLAVGPAQKRQVRDATRDILGRMRAIRVPHNLIPADPADFSLNEQLASLFAGIFVPYVGGAPFDVLIGLNNNHANGANFGETVSLADLTVTKTLTAAYYVYYLSLWLFGQIGGQVEGAVLGALFPWLPAAGERGAVSITKILVVLANLPLVHGLVNFHNVMRSMCFREDDTTGTGRGAQYRKDTAKMPEPLTPAEQRALQRKLKVQRAKAKRPKSRNSTAKRPNSTEPVQNGTKSVQNGTKPAER